MCLYKHKIVKVTACGCLLPLSLFIEHIFLKNNLKPASSHKQTCQRTPPQMIQGVLRKYKR